MSETPRSTVAAQCYRYACAESGVGRILIVMSENGVVDVVSGDNLKQLLSCALDRHPGWGFIPDRGVHTHWVAAVVRRVERQWVGTAMPVDLASGALASDRSSSR